MTRKFTKFEIATIRRTAQNVNPMVTKKNKIMAQIVELGAQVDELQTMIDQYEAAIKNITRGYSTEDLIVKVKDEKTGIAKFVFKYPDTILPPELDVLPEEVHIDMGEEAAEETQVEVDPFSPVEL